jgi:hypothetical protein
MARVTRTSIISGYTRTLELKKYTQEEFDSRMEAVKRGYVSLEDAFPDISKSAKDFIVYGTTIEEWEKYDAGENTYQLPLIYDSPDIKR